MLTLPHTQSHTRGYTPPRRPSHLRSVGTQAHTCSEAPARHKHTHRPTLRSPSPTQRAWLSGTSVGSSETEVRLLQWSPGMCSFRPGAATALFGWLPAPDPCPSRPCTLFLFGTLSHGVSEGCLPRDPQGPGLALSRDSLGPSPSPTKFLWPTVYVCLYLSFPIMTLHQPLRTLWIKSL